MKRTIPQRLFTADDVVQLEILNEMADSHCIQIRPIQLPLKLNGTYTHWVQVGASS